MEIKLSGASAPLVQQLSIKGDWQTYRTITAADAAYDNLHRPKTLLTTTDPINCSEVDKVGLRLRSVTQGASLTYKAVVWGSRDSVTNAAPGQVVATGTLTTASDLDAATGNYISPYVSINPRWGRFLQVFVTAVTDIDTDHEGYLDAVGMSTDNEVNLGDITFKADVVETDVEAITGTGAAAKNLADVVSALTALRSDISTSLPASDLVCGSVTGRAYVHLPVTLAVNPTEGQVGSVGDGTHVDEFEFCDDPGTYEPTPGKIPVQIGETAAETLANMLAAIATAEVTYTQDDTNAVLISEEPGLLVTLTASMPAGEGNVVGTHSYPIAPVPIANESMPCKAVWIGAPVTIDTGAAVNTKGVLVGNDTTQNFPIMPSNFEGKIFRVDDASNLYVKAGEDGEGVNYIIYQ